jgi:tight adherence protein B
VTVTGTRSRAGAVLARAGLVLTAGLLTVSVPTVAHAAEGSIDHVEPVSDETVRVLYSLPGASTQPDLDSLTVTLNGKAVEASAEIAAQAKETVRRTAVLAIDVSNSMRTDNRFEEAKAAAKAFLAAAPDDLYVGIVTFAGDVEVAQEPSLDRAGSAAVIDDLTLSLQTRLYDGLLQAVTATGTDGARSILVLSDGKDTSDTPVSDVTDAIEAAQVKVDVVALSQSAQERELLQPLADAGDGNVISAEDPEALSAVFEAEAESLANQVLISMTRPDADITEGNLAVSIDAAGETYRDSAFVTLGSSTTPTGPDPTDLDPVDPQGFQITREMMLGGLAAVGLGVLILLLGALGVFSGSKKETVEDRIAAYTSKGARKKKAAAAQGQGVTAQAVGFAERALEGNEDFSAKLDRRLEAAGMAIKPAEWLLAHAGIAFLAALLGLLLGGGNILFALAGLAFGIVAPWVFLSFKEGHRVKAFKGQLADTLQLMSGSLSAGLSLAQSVDTVVREGADPIGSEFRRALVETRLGVELEAALDGVAERMKSKDFEWVVMAIKIQREVGGNLAELLQKVSTTIREREYLERQVLALSAEGRLSVWILGGLPPGFMAYLMMANPEYLSPLTSTTIGYILLGVMGVLLVGGILWMKKLVKVDV